MKMRVVGALLWTSVLLAAGDARAVINHPADDGTIGSVAKPPAAVVGQWSGNASAVAIDPNYILTTRHQGGGVNTNVVFNGITYKVAQEIAVGTADLRIARITELDGDPANLASFVPIYSGSDAPTLAFTLGGFGRGRGADLTTTGGTYGYQWGAGGNSTLRFGRNQIEGSGVATGTILSGSVNVSSDVIVADFDGPGALTSVPFESIITEFDSGSGWFVENGPGNWQVAGISRGVGHQGVNVGQPSAQALFRSNLNAAVPVPDAMDAVRLSSYRTFIDDQIPEPSGLTLLASAGAFSLARRRRR
jgi:hypothetical protein